MLGRKERWEGREGWKECEKEAMEGLIHVISFLPFTREEEKQEVKEEKKVGIQGKEGGALR